MFWEGGANDDLLALSVIPKLAKVGWRVSEREFVDPLLVFRESKGTINWEVSCIKAALDLLLWSWLVRIFLILLVIVLPLIAIDSVESGQGKEESPKSLDMQSMNSSKDYTVIITTSLSPSFAITAVWLLQWGCFADCWRRSLGLKIMADVWCFLNHQWQSWSIFPNGSVGIIMLLRTVVASLFGNILRYLPNGTRVSNRVSELWWEFLHNCSHGPVKWILFQYQVR